MRISLRLVAAVVAASSVACSGHYIDDGVAPAADATVDTEVPDLGYIPFDAGVPDTADTDPGDAWWTHFDAPHDPVLPPPEGTFPPVGRDFCPKLECGPDAICDVPSGWCCSGRWDDRRCVCGLTLGCQPPQVCCTFPGEKDARCATLDECNAGATP